MIDSITPGMINISQGVSPMAQKFTISIPDELVNTLDKLTVAWGTTRSGVFARLLQEAERKRLEKEMEEGYKAMTGDDVELYLPAQAEVVLRVDKAR